MSYAKLGLDCVDVFGKRVFIRADFNVPQDKNDPTKILNRQRIALVLPAVRFCLGRGCKSVVLAAHLGQPGGTVKPEFSLAPVAKVVEELLDRPVIFLKDCCGADVEAACADPAHGSVILLENLRFHVEEEGKGIAPDGSEAKANKDDVAAFRASLRKLADIYCNNCFNTAHLAHSSMVGEGFPVKCAGFRTSAELNGFRKVLDSPEEPVLAIIGGEKLSGRIQLVKNLLDKVNKMIIGGDVAFTFLNVMHGTKIGKSKFDEEGAKVVPEIVAKAKEKNVEIVLPVDFVCSSDFFGKGDIKTADPASGVPNGYMGLDCGPKSIELNNAAVKAAKTIIWDGAVGAFEMAKFEAGTKALMDSVVAATKTGTVTVIAGGDTGMACNKYDAFDIVSHCSYGGEASVDILKGKVLPGIDALDPAPVRANRRKIVFGNWKCNPGTLKEALDLCAAFAGCSFDPLKTEVGIFCNALHGDAVMSALARCPIEVGVQNISKHFRGAFTGEWAARMASECGYGWTLIGHSERRTLYGETDDDCVEKFIKAQWAGLRVIYCIGETMKERDDGVTDEVNRRMLENVVPLVRDWEHFAIAYEPVWSIGLDRTATPEQAQETQSAIRAYVRSKCGDLAADKVRILYGGSEISKNCDELIAMPDIDGFLVGGNALSPKFLEIIESCNH